MAGQLGIPKGIRELLPEIEGKHVLHLQCATGESTAELVELGALVSAVDLSTEAFWERMIAPDAPFPTTAAASPGDFQAVFDEAFTDGADSIVCVDVAGTLSGTIKSATTCAHHGAPDHRERERLATLSRFDCATRRSLVRERP